MMTRINRKTLRIAALLLCLVLIFLGSLINRTRAALLEGNGTTLELGMETLDVQLVENGKAVTDGGSLFGSLDSMEMDPGYTYGDTVSARNSGASEEYVRVIVTKYWTKTGENGAAEKVTTVKPDSIELIGGSGWTENPAESTAEQTVYYYNTSLASGAESTALFTGIRLSGDIAKGSVTEKTAGDSTVLTAAFDYDGLSFNVEAEVQAIQYEHAQEAAGSAWGIKNVTFADGRVTVD